MRRRVELYTSSPLEAAEIGFGTIVAIIALTSPAISECNSGELLYSMCIIWRPLLSHHWILHDPESARWSQNPESREKVVAARLGALSSEASKTSVSSSTSVSCVVLWILNTAEPEACENSAEAASGRHDHPSATLTDHPAES